MTGTAGKNEKQTVVVTGAAAGDKLVLTFGGQSTAELALRTFSSADLQTALRALSSINGANVAVTDGDPSAGWSSSLARWQRPLRLSITGVCGRTKSRPSALDASVSDGTFTLTFGRTDDDRPGLQHFVPTTCRRLFGP